MGKFLNLIVGSCVLASLMVGCGFSNEKEIYQSNRNEVVKVKSAIQEIIKDEVLIGSLVRMEMLNDYLLIKDAKSYDTLIHVFDKKIFKTNILKR